MQQMKADQICDDQPHQFNQRFIFDIEMEHG